MRPHVLHLSTRALRRHLPSVYQSSALLRPLSRLQGSPQNTIYGYRFASTSSASAPHTVAAVGQPLPIGSHLDSSQGKRYAIDEVLSERPAAGRIWCVYRATYVDFV